MATTSEHGPTRSTGPVKMMAREPLFRLPPVAVEIGHDEHDLPPLASVEPAFALPSLDETVSGAERLLKNLRLAHSVPVPPHNRPISPSSKGKEKAVELPTASSDNGFPRGIWDVVLEEGGAGPSRPRLFKAGHLPLRTWDDLHHEHGLPSAPTTFMTESSRATFEAFLTVSEGQERTRSSKEQVVPPYESSDLIRSMIRATLGTVTDAAIQWKHKGNRFGWSGEAGRPVAVERRAAESAVQPFLDVATAIRRLEMIVDSLGSIPATPTHHALLHALSTYLTYIKRYLGEGMDGCPDAGDIGSNQWTGRLRWIRDLCAELCEVAFWPLSQPRSEGLPAHASTLITHLHNRFAARFNTSSPLQQNGQVVLALAYLLQQTSGPILHLLHQWLGVSDSSALDESLDEEFQPWADLGITRRALSSGQTRWEYEFSSRKMPGFVPREHRRTLFEAGRSLRILREASAGQHPLCNFNWGLKAEWAWGMAADVHNEVRLHVKRVKVEMDHWRRSTSTRSRPMSGSAPAMRKPVRKARKGLPQEFLEAARTPPSPLASQVPLPALPDAPPISDLWYLFSQAPGSHLQSAEAPLWTPAPLDHLNDFIGRHSSDPLLSDSPTLDLFISHRLLAPLLAHANLISASLVAFYLEDLGFLDHLDILRSFWLGGDAGFCERVSGALFGKETAGAGEALGLGRRARTRARMGLDKHGGAVEPEGEWGIGLGLGLSERNKWPPGGAELAYALRATLLDEEQTATERGEAWDGIEDKVSFAIRALPEAQDGRRARWLDPQAIEALDFLYLAYSPPPTISIVLPTSIMDKYQAVHSFLLRLCRVDTVARTMYWDIAHQVPTSAEPPKIGVDARPVSRTTRQVLAQPSDGIFARGSRATHQLHTLRWRMMHFVTALHRYVLDIAIGSNWLVMRRRLDKVRRASTAPTATSESRPMSPTTEPDDEELYEEAIEPSLDEDDGPEPTSLHQLSSIHSLVIYHHVVLDRILRACLLAPSAGHEVTYQLLMTLFGLVLDLGKAVKEVQRGVLSTEEGEEIVRQLGEEWREKEAVFMHALERLSLRTNTSRSAQELLREGKHRDVEQDLDLLLGGDEEERGVGHQEGRNELQELLLRLNLGKSVVRRGTYAD